jgi:histone acetyltransferase (RNA polymerase elongator complex component)
VSISAPLKPLIIPIFIPHQGCPHRCTFCNQAAITADSAPVALETCIEHYLAYASPKRGPTQVAFYGGNFLGLDRPTVTALLDRLCPWLENGQITAIRFSTRPDTITQERLGWIAPYPVDTIELGVQSMNDTVLHLTRRGHTAADTRQAVERLKNHSYQIGIQLMLGLPGDDTKGALDGAEDVTALAPDFVRIYPTLVLAGSPLATIYKAGHYTPLSLAEAVDQAKALVRRFHHYNIPVIRLGLQAADGLEDPAIVLAGPYHPAFGHMVYASLYRDAAHALLAQAAPLPETPVLKVHPRHLSRLQGLNRENLAALRGIFNRPRLSVQADKCLPIDEVTCGEFRVSVWSLPQLTIA